LSTSAGVFNLTDLNVGTYTLHVDAPGFTAFERRGLVVSANRIVNVDVQLTVAPTATTTVVTEATPIIDTESSALANVKTSRDLEQLPMLARQAGDQGIYAYTTLNTGVSVIPGNGGVPVFQGVPSGTGALPTMDGIAVMGYIIGTGPEAPSVDGVQQLNVQTNNAPAEFATAATFTVVSKSGTNELHGSVFWDYNGNSLNARDFFSPSVPFRVYHNFGGSIGGPIRRNKTFFFGDYEGSRESALRLLLASVPLPAWRNGDFSSLPTPVIDPSTGAPFPGNIIPTERLSAVSQKAQTFLYPSPNFGPPGSQAGNFRQQFPGLSAFDDFDHFDTRVDHSFSSRDSIFGRFSYRRMPTNYTDDLPSIGYTTQVYQGRSGAFSYTHIFTPALVNEFRAGGAYIRNAYAPALIGSDLLAKFGIQGAPPVGRIHNVPIFNIDGVTAANMDDAGDSYQDVISTDYQATDNLSWTRGAHFMKFGFDVVRDYLGGANWSSSMYGAYNFTGVYTGTGYADFLLGIPQTTRLTIPTPNRLIRGTTWSLYAQDTFKVNRRLTLNYGVRWQLSGPYYDKHGTLYNFNPANGQLVIPDEGLPRVSPFFPKNIPVETASHAGYPADSLMNFNKRNIYPRFGFAYKPFSNDKTVVRAGYGIYTNIIYQPLARRMTGGPFSGTETYVNSITNGVPLFSFPNPFLLSGTTGTQDVRGFNPNIRVPYTQQWNFTVEHQIGQVGLRVSYVGSHTVDLLYSRNLDQPQPSTSPYSSSLAPYSLYRQVIWTENGGSDRYNAMEVAVIKTYGKNLTLNSGWTWAKDLTDTQDVGSVAGPVIQNQFNRRAEEGNNGVVVTHRVFGYAVWTLPFGQGQRFLSHQNRVVEALFGGWSTAWNFVTQSGLFYTPSFDGFDPSNTNTFGGRPDVIGNPNLASSRSISQWFNINAFVIPGCPASQPVCQNPANVGRFGNVGVNTLRGPGMVNLDFALTKDFKVTERIRLQFRANATNLLNHPNFSIPDSDISDVGNAGNIFGTVRAQLGQPAPRVINLMLRFKF
jgi:hypothetical protein